MESQEFGGNIKMVKVGNLRLTKAQKKRIFHLPIKQTVIVPSTSGIISQKTISKTQMNIRVNDVRRFLSKNFGGYTSVKATGGFILLKNGKLVKEKVVKVTSFSTKGNFKQFRPIVIKQIGIWGNKWKQESIGYEYEGDLFIITPPKTKTAKIKVIKKKK